MYSELNVDLCIIYDFDNKLCTGDNVVTSTCSNDSAVGCEVITGIMNDSLETMTAITHATTTNYMHCFY